MDTKFISFTNFNLQLISLVSGETSSLKTIIDIYGDFNVNVDTDCMDQRNFLNLLDTSNLSQNVNKSTHLHGHILDLILSPSDSSFVSNVTVGEMVSDHVLLKCHLDFACSAISKVDSISYCKYHFLPAGWLSDSYHRAKSIRCQFKCMWHKDRSQLSRSRLRRQIARCNVIINRVKAE